MEPNGDNHITFDPWWPKREQNGGLIPKPSKAMVPLEKILPSNCFKKLTIFPVYANAFIYNRQHMRPEEVFHVATDIADTGAQSEILQVVVQCLRETIQQWLVWAEDQNK